MGPCLLAIFQKCSVHLFLSALSSVERIVQSTHQYAKKTQKNHVLFSPINDSQRNEKGQLGLVEGSMALFPVLALVALVDKTLLTVLNLVCQTSEDKLSVAVLKG